MIKVYLINNAHYQIYYLILKRGESKYIKRLIKSIIS